MYTKPWLVRHTRWLPPLAIFIIKFSFKICVGNSSVPWPGRIPMGPLPSCQQNIMLRSTKISNIHAVIQNLLVNNYSFRERTIIESEFVIIERFCYLLRLRRDRRKSVKLGIFQTGWFTLSADFRRKVSCQPTAAGVKKLEWLPFHVVSKYPQCIVWFCHKARAQQTGGETDRQTGGETGRITTPKTALT